MFQTAFREAGSAKEATETETGLKTRTCSRCGETETEVIPVLNHTHTLIKVDAKVVDDKAVVSVINECDVIPKEKLQRLFGKFIRLEDNTTRTTRGTGLGLFIVKGLVEAMGGSIELSSTDGCGFCATVTIGLAGENEVDA